MAFSTSVDVGYDVQALRKQQFPVSQTTVYLNHAALSPLPQRAHDAMQNMIKDFLYYPQNMGKALGELDAHFCEAIRGLINAESVDEIVGVQNTALGFNLVAQALNWDSPEPKNIIIADGEYPSNVYPWMRLQEQYNVELRLIEPVDGGLTLEALQEYVDEETCLVAASAIQFFSGHRTDLKAIGSFCHENNIIFAVDAIQAAGHIPIDVQAMHISILCAGGQKSLMGPSGYGFLYVQHDLAEEMNPTIAGPAGVEDFEHTLQYHRRLRPAAKRFSIGTENLVDKVGLLESVSLIRELGPTHIDTYTTALADYLIDHLQSRAYNVVTPANHGPIVTFRAAPTETETNALVNAMGEQNVVVTWRWDKQNVAHLRASLHCYNTQEDIDRMLAVLQERQS